MIGDKERLFFFARIVRNNFHSTTSRFYNEYNKFKFTDITDHNVRNKEYEESEINIDWVNKIITIHKKGEWWYYARLFELYLEEGASITKLSKRTTIPLNSVSRDINKYRRELRRLRNEYFKKN